MAPVVLELSLPEEHAINTSALCKTNDCAVRYNFKVIMGESPSIAAGMIA
jgi:hypothetical protein